ncbi:hypothetical protein [Clostridioides difficile]|uniref:hypothetical protein n=1 Tax=Clostridioides difficile TaxID=1496 RepID=UPI0013F146E8|nr:hypothetical protein [Clostridioides difficile]
MECKLTIVNSNLEGEPLFILTMWYVNQATGLLEEAKLCPFYINYVVCKFRIQN